MRTTIHILTAAILLSCGSTANAERRVRDICRVKGQEDNVLQGLGLVVGLNGTGDTETPTIRALAEMIRKMDYAPNTGQTLAEELNNTKNVALVFVTATVPAAGAREGGRVNCTVNAVSAKSLAGGYLMATPLLSANPDDRNTYAIGQGELTLETVEFPNAAKVKRGCKFLIDFPTSFTKDGKFTLVLDENHAGFHRAVDIEESVNNLLGSGQFGGSGRNDIAKAIDQRNIEVTIPSSDLENPVLFIATVLDAQVYASGNTARVVVNERSGVVVVGTNVEVGPIAVKHKGITVATGDKITNAGFIPVAPAETTLESLVEALNALKVSTADTIAILKAIDRSGHLYGKLIVE